MRLPVCSVRTTSTPLTKYEISLLVLRITVQGGEGYNEEYGSMLMLRSCSIPFKVIVWGDFYYSIISTSVEGCSCENM